MRSRLLLIATLVLWAVGLTAQGAAPSLSEVEQLRVDLLQARTLLAQLQAGYDGCRAEIGTLYHQLGQVRAQVASQVLTAEEARLKADVEAAHPGYTWNPKTGAFTRKTADPPGEKR